MRDPRLQHVVVGWIAHVYLLLLSLMMVFDKTTEETGWVFGLGAVVLLGLRYVRCC